MAISPFGLTGGIGSGKSTVGRYFASRGVEVIDADHLARDVVRPGEPALAEITRAFGTELLDADGALRRQALARLVFSDPEKLEQLNAIVHPRVAALYRARLEALAAKGVEVVCYEVPLLYERGLDATLSPVVVVVASLENRIARLAARDGFSRAEAELRISRQMPLEEKARRASYVIDNDGPLERTHAAAEEVLERICADLGTPLPVRAQRVES